MRSSIINIYRRYDTLYSSRRRSYNTASIPVEIWMIILDYCIDITPGDQYHLLESTLFPAYLRRPFSIPPSAFKRWTQLRLVCLLWASILGRYYQPFRKKDFKLVEGVKCIDLAHASKPALCVAHILDVRGIYDSLSTLRIVIPRQKNHIKQDNSKNVLSLLLKDGLEFGSLRCLTFVSDEAAEPPQDLWPTLSRNFPLLHTLRISLPFNSTDPAHFPHLTTLITGQASLIPAGCELPLLKHVSAQTWPEEIPETIESLLLQKSLVYQPAFWQQYPDLKTFGAPLLYLSSPLFPPQPVWHPLKHLCLYKVSMSIGRVSWAISDVVEKMPSITILSIDRGALYGMALVNVRNICKTAGVELRFLPRAARLGV
ncbi:hypothetical protein CPB86DRAFT_787824 [Serendipita vermifera]|nr:hypothetical protein CPB86DRAFT_787824 [Serendipita vermifera]